jgi:hypothetical protein
MGSRLLAALSCATLLALTSCPLAKPQDAPLRFQLQDNLIRVPILLEGHPAEAVLDSGTGSLALDRAFALSAGLKPAQALGTVPGGGAAVPMFSLAPIDLQFGQEHLTQIPAIAIDLGHLTSSAGFLANVLLGKPAFDQRALRIDYPNRQISFLPVAADVSCANPVPIAFVGGAPVVEVSLRTTPEGEPVRLHLIVDLGTRHYAAILGGPFLDTPTGKELLRKSTSLQIGTGTGGAVEGNSVQVNSLRIGLQEFSGVTVALTNRVGAFAAGVADGSLGVPLWKDGTITFDYPHQRICLDIPPTR